MVAHMTTSPTGQNHVRDDSHYLTSSKTLIVSILTFNFCQILARIVSQAGEHLLTEDRHYLTSGKNESVQILIKST